jgi:two-component system OmpR family sensor kinase
MSDSGRRQTMSSHPRQWFRSFYWRIALSFVVFVIGVIVAQSAMFSYVMARRNAQDPSRAPNNIAIAVASDLGAALEANPGLDLDAHLRTHYGRAIQPMFVVLMDGRAGSNGVTALSQDLRRSAEAALHGAAAREGQVPRLQGPVVTAPIRVGRELEGLVVLPPPPRGGVLREVGRWLSLPATILLILGTTLAALFIFAPARRRLRALEDATDRLARGDLQARASEEGNDEISRVAKGFNRMARELAARDEALRASDRLRRQMLADVSHELKTPLTSMRGYIETLQMPDIAADSDRRARYFATIERETRRLERIVSDLLDLARYENRVVPYEARVFSVERLFEQVVSRHEREAHERDIGLTISVAASADQLLADPHRIDQAVDNLVSNALRHTPDGGTIALQGAAHEGVARLSVIDSGEGIAPEHLPHVFDRFYKVDSSRPGGSAGSGLGLSIVKAIIEEHGGSVAVTSVAGRTEFTLMLPQFDGDHPPPPATQSASANL